MTLRSCSNPQGSIAELCLHSDKVSKILLLISDLMMYLGYPFFPRKHSPGCVSATYMPLENKRRNYQTLELLLAFPNTTKTVEKLNISQTVIPT